jgi:hypothetical protein
VHAHARRITFHWNRQHNRAPIDPGSICLRETMRQPIRPIHLVSARAPAPTLPPQTTARNHFQDFVNNPKYSDVTFSVDDKEVRAHKIMIAKSPLLRVLDQQWYA